MEKRVRLKTWVVDLSRDASTVDAIRAALVESDAGNLAATVAVPPPPPPLAVVGFSPLP